MAFCATGQEVLNEIQNRYEKTNDFEARFIQEYIGKVMKQPNRGEGKVYFKKRGMMRWDYTVPNQKLLSDGHTLWYYQPEEKQVHRFRCLKSPQREDALGLLGWRRKS